MDMMRSVLLVMFAAGALVVNCTPAMVKAVEPYSISPEFEDRKRHV
jgi:hypothetical protein